MSDLAYLMVLIPALPLAAALITAALGKSVLKEKSHLPALAATIGSFILSLMLLDGVSQGVRRQKISGQHESAVGFERVHTIWTWAVVDDAYIVPTAAGPLKLDFNVGVTLRADTLTVVMLCMVTFISSLIVYYASGYMHGDPGYWRFFAYVSLFVFSMTMLVSVSNFVLLYVFWEAVGVCSYLLIGFWFHKPEAAAAGKKAFLVNRVGDFGFALGVFLIWTTFGTLNFHDTAVAADGSVVEAAAAKDDARVVPGVLGQTHLRHGSYPRGSIALAICLLLMLGACGKSAQFPLHVWLPDAMEGPTPVSALIHAATMVTAGVYMVARCTPLFLASPDAQLVVAAIGCFTALLAGTIAVTQTDLKRVLAYSTISQLGFMFMGLGAGTLAGITAGMFHLFTHAFFKALLFLGAGSVMHAMGGVIDIRSFGGLRRRLPITHWTFLFGCLALGGVIPFSGFWSKDAILAAVAHAPADTTLGFAPFYQVLYYTALFTAFLTAFYTFRAYFLTFHGEERIPHEAGHHAHESPVTMTGPLVVLAICAAVVGALYELTGGFADFLRHTPSLMYAERLAAHAAGGHAAEGSHLLVAVVSTGAALAGIALAAMLYLGKPSKVESLTVVMKPMYVASLNKFFLDQVYWVLFVWPLEYLGKISYAVDRWVIDGMVDTIGRLPPALGSRLRSLQIGLTPFYALAMLLGLLVLIGTLLKWPTI